jgi:hypothetical protein
LKRGLLSAAKRAKLQAVQCAEVLLRCNKRSPDPIDIEFRTIKLYDAQFLAEFLESASQLLARMMAVY